MMGYLNSFSASGVGNLNKNFPKIQMPGGGVFKLRLNWYITSISAEVLHFSKQLIDTPKSFYDTTLGQFLFVSNEDCNLVIS